MRTSHFHCTGCHPVLVPGQTRAICGAVIPPPVAGRGISRRCTDCKQAIRQHAAQTGHKAA